MGAWIETATFLSARPLAPVAPRVGAWIETTIRVSEERAQTKSHPVWVRGLKQIYQKAHELICRSHPVWVRGLKHVFHRSIAEVVLSHPVWVRGLKQSVIYSQNCSTKVAPRVGAWIETERICANSLATICRTPCGCVD